MKTQNDFTWILVADDKAARIFRVMDPHTPWTLGLDTRHDTRGVKGDKALDAAGTRSFAHHASNHLGALKTSAKPGDKAEHLFIRELAHILEKGQADTAFGHLILVAPPHFLGILRESLSRGLSEKVYASVAKDYGHMPVDDLRKLLNPLLPVL